MHPNSEYVLLFQGRDGWRPILLNGIGFSQYSGVGTAGTSDGQ
jgi:hypothetical protein